MTVFLPEEVSEGMKRLGAYPEAKFLRQHLMSVLLSTISPGASDGAVRCFEGGRNLAAQLITSLGLNREAGDGGARASGSEYVGGASSQYARASASIPRRVPIKPPSASGNGDGSAG